MVNISKPELKTAHRHSINNRRLLAGGGERGCFHCLRTFDASQVTDWTGDHSTALCPHCGIDAVLSSKIDSIDQGFLRSMRDFWFEQTVPRDQVEELTTLQKPDAAE